ncbi:hypothetical protein HGRIS_007312 [Hohenbuehelia grisea]|uniref:Uncharacterized protein n=1 Tax=Hohenbuehelia grisea TaxID=104357 RepID=A0ABR3J4S1_9AGAR
MLYAGCLVDSSPSARTLLPSPHQTSQVLITLPCLRKLSHLESLCILKRCLAEEDVIHILNETPYLISLPLFDFSNMSHDVFSALTLRPSGRNLIPALKMLCITSLVSTAAATDVVLDFLETRCKLGEPNHQLHAVNLMDVNLTLGGPSPVTVYRLQPAYNLEVAIL